MTALRPSRCAPAAAAAAPRTPCAPHRAACRAAGCAPSPPVCPHSRRPCRPSRRAAAAAAAVRSRPRGCSRSRFFAGTGVQHFVPRRSAAAADSAASARTASRLATCTSRGEPSRRERCAKARTTSPGGHVGRSRDCGAEGLRQAAGRVLAAHEGGKVFRVCGEAWGIRSFCMAAAASGRSGLMSGAGSEEGRGGDFCVRCIFIGKCTRRVQALRQQHLQSNNWAHRPGLKACRTKSFVQLSGVKAPQ
eukprot:353632-Chlamydomonas_euryale.AAC.11